MNIFGIHFHSWKAVGSIEEYKFEGETCKQFIQKYRICIECNKIQDYTYDSQGGFWWSLRKCESEAVQKRIQDDTYIIRD